ncbi:MAG: deaminase [Bdellovibrionia bacterium]
MTATPKKQVLIVGLVAPSGTNIKLFKNKLSTLLADNYDVTAHQIKLTNLIENEYADQVKSAAFNDLPQCDQVDKKITLGNKIREVTQDNSIFAKFALHEILECYKKISISGSDRHVIIIDQFKRPEEVRYLENIFGHSFWLVALESTPRERSEYLTSGDSTLVDKARALTKRDENEGQDWGQKMRETYLMAHSIFSAHIQDEPVLRFFDLIFKSHLITPNPDEYFMNMAFSSSLKTGDLSRQVGAVLVTKKLDQFSCGANEVNKFGGGSYWPDGQPHRDLEKEEDANKIRLDDLRKDIAEKIEAKLPDTLGKIMPILEKTKIADITEYQRATHAEMDAILSAARLGISTRGATLYCTTFPCHNCAKHIVSCGIDRVIFLEPYPKSFSIDLHSDAISITGEAEKVSMSEFTGITHVRFRDLFSMVYSTGEKIKRKDDYGKVLPFDRKTTDLKFPFWEESIDVGRKIVLKTFTPEAKLLESTKEKTG